MLAFATLRGTQCIRNWFEKAQRRGRFCWKEFSCIFSWWYIWVWLKKFIQNTKTWIVFFSFIPLTFLLLFTPLFPLATGIKGEKEVKNKQTKMFFLMEGWESASASVKKTRNVTSKQKICEKGCWGKFCQTIFIGIFITIIINPLYFQHYLLLLGKTDDFFRNPGLDPKIWNPETGSSHKKRTVPSNVTNVVPAVGLLIHFPCPKLKITFSSSHTGLSLPQSTNNKQLLSKKVILYQKKSPLISSLLWSTNVLSKGHPILTFPFFQE